jgi:Tol biopolymer transport system component
LLTELVGQQSEIVLLDISENSITRVTNNNFSDYDPGFSPDGKQIAYISEEHGLGELYVMDLDGSSQSRMTFDQNIVWSPAWSPDGTQIAFDQGGPTVEGNIFILHLESGKIDQITDLYGLKGGPVKDLVTGELTHLIDHPASDSIEDWSSSENLLLITSSRDVDDPLRKAKLYLFDLEINETWTLFPNNGDSEFGPNEGQAVWSPDGNWIALTINGSMCIVNKDGEIWECVGKKYQYTPHDWVK